MLLELKARLSFFVIFLCLGMTLSLPVLAQKKAKAQEPAAPLSVAKGGKLVYGPDEKGDRVPDFSYSGYKGGDAPIPEVPIRVVVPVKDGDATARIQAA